MSAQRLRRAAVATLSVASLIAAAPAAADPPPLWAVPSADPLRASSLPLDPAEAMRPEAGRWRLETTVGYFNVQESSWHAPTLHHDLGLDGRPLSSGEIAFLELAYPDDEMYLIDVEGWQVDLRATVALGRGLALSAHLPWVEVGSPHWDDLARSVHQAIGAEKDGFEVFPYGQAVVWAFNGDERVERMADLVSTGFGDLDLSLSGSLGRWAGGSHRWAAVVEAPTGDDGTLAGSGGWDLGLRWYGRWDLGNGRLLAALGATRLDPDGGWLGLERRDVWHAHVAYQHRLGAAWSFRVAVRGDGSPLAGFASSDLGGATLLFDLGIRRELGTGSWLAVSFGENLPQVGVTPDYTLQLQLGGVVGGVTAATGVP